MELACLAVTETQLDIRPSCDRRTGFGPITRIMKTMTPRELAEHLRALKASKEQDLDELLTDLLVHSYPTKAVQNS